MRSRLAPFLGRWTDDAGRGVTIEPRGDGALVSVRDAAGAPFQRTLLEGASTTVAMPAAVSEEGTLVVEVGTPGVGPTYVLEAVGGALLPSVHIGLYDDWEDDLGVPWAQPLSPYRPADRIG